MQTGPYRVHETNEVLHGLRLFCTLTSKKQKVLFVLSLDKIESSIPLPTFNSPQIYRLVFLHPLNMAVWVCKPIPFISPIQTMNQTSIISQQQHLIYDVSCGSQGHDDDFDFCIIMFDVMLSSFDAPHIEVTYLMCAQYLGCHKQLSLFFQMDFLFYLDLHLNLDNFIFIPGLPLIYNQLATKFYM